MRIFVSLLNWAPGLCQVFVSIIVTVEKILTPTTLYSQE